MSGVRRKSRSCALQMLYQNELNPGFDPEAVERFWQIEGGSKKMRAFAMELAEATVTHREQIDQRLESALENWKLARLSVVVRNLLRMAACEMEFLRSAPFQVVINEAVDLARDFMDEDSGKFVNSVLERYHQQAEGRPPEAESAGGTR